MELAESALLSLWLCDLAPERISGHLCAFSVTPHLFFDKQCLRALLVHQLLGLGTQFQRLLAAECECEVRRFEGILLPGRPRGSRLSLDMFCVALRWLSGRWHI